MQEVSQIKVVSQMQEVSQNYLLEVSQYHLQVVSR